MNTPELIYQIALTQLKGIGPVKAKSIISKLDTIECLFKEKIEVLEKRKEENEKLDLQDFQKQWVFPSLTSKSGHLEEPRKSWRKVLERAGIQNLRLHDIRRTLGSYQAISGASLQVIGKSLGHKSSTATEVYARMNLDPIKQSVDKAIDLMESYKKQ